MDNLASTSIDDKVITILDSDPNIRVRRDLTGREVTTFAIGGALRALADVGSVESLQLLLRVLKDQGCAYTVLGAGSNLLIDDAGVDRWLIRLSSSFRTLSEELNDEKVRIEVGGAYPVIALSRELSNKGYIGIEFAGGIPASLGGAVRMNAGAHGGEFSQIVEWVDVVSHEGVRSRLANSEMNFSYRHSVIDSSDIVVGAGLALSRGSIDETMKRRAHCLEERRSRQPLSMPSAGSVFKNPSPEKTAGWLIEQVGLKGYQIGDVAISDKHANWIVNPSKRGKAQEVRDLITLCQERVEQKFGIALKTEIISLF